MDKEESNEKSVNLLTINVTLGFICLCLIVFIGVGLYQRYEANKAEVPEVVMNLLNDIVIEKQDLYECLPKYLTTSAETDLSEEESLLYGIGTVGVVRDALNFEYIFYEEDVEINDFTVDVVGMNYVEITLYSDEGLPIYPRILFVYELSGNDSMIDDYTISREQAIFQRSEEHSDKWEE